MAIYETIDRKRAEAKEMKNKSASMEELETPTNSVKSFQMSSTRYIFKRMTTENKKNQVDNSKMLPSFKSQAKTSPSKI